MTSPQIQDIQDRIAKEEGYDDFSSMLQEYQEGWISEDDIKKVINRAIDLSGTREIKVPTKEDIESSFPDPPISLLGAKNRLRREGIAWAIKQIKEINPYFPLPNK